MKWSLRVGSIFGADIRLHASLLFLIPYALFAFRPDSTLGFLRVLFLIAAVFACVAFHEVGHTAAAYMYGYKAASIVLWPLGGMTTFDRRPEKTLPNLVITAAGPLVNLVIFAYLTVISAALYFLQVARILPPLPFWIERLDLLQLFVGLAAANLSLAVFNLIPVYPLDGGQIARSLLKHLFGERRADLVILVISLPAAALLLILGVVLGDILILVTGLLLALAASSLNMGMLNGLQLGWLYLFDRPNFYLRRYDFDPAIEEYTRAIRRHPGRASLYAARAVVYFYLEELPAAEADVRQALSLDPKNYLAHLLLGELYMLRKQPALALRCYNQAVELQPMGAVAYLDRGSFYQSAGDLPAALRDMEKGVELGRGVPIGFLLRSIVRYQMGDLAGAKADALNAQRYAPQWMLVFSPVFKETLAGQLNWALDYYALALRQFPNAYQVYQGRGDAFTANDRLTEAAADYQRALQLAPRNAELYLRRGQAYERAGQRRLAAADFQQAVALADRAHIRRQAQAHLQRLMPFTPALPAAPAATPEPPAPDDPPAAGAAPAP